MIVALITAGGIGGRMNCSGPKQFVEIAGAPVIIHTLRAFQNHPDIDAICVSCLAGWEQWLTDNAAKYNITKLAHIVPGGATGQESIYNGLTHLRRYYDDDDIVLIHDGVRPLVSQKIISDCIATTRKYGCAIAAIPAQEAILQTTDGVVGTRAIARETLRRTQTPHGFRIGDVCQLYECARTRGITNTVAACTLMLELGRVVYFYNGAEKNIKLTTPEDFDIFNAFCRMEHESDCNK